MKSVSKPLGTASDVEEICDCILLEFLLLLEVDRIAKRTTRGCQAWGTGRSRPAEKGTYSAEVRCWLN